MANMDRVNDCFCELVPLYALDLLPESERAWVEQEVAQCPELAEELAEYQLAVTAVAYDVPDLPMATGLKNQLFDRLGLDAPPPSPLPETISPNLIATGYSAIRSQDLNWQPHPTPGVSVAIVHRDEVTRELVGFLKAEPGVCYPFHRHAAIEEIFMMEGDLVVGDQVYGAGDYIRSLPGSSHAPYTDGGCRFFFHTSMDDEYPELATAASV